MDLVFHLDMEDSWIGKAELLEELGEHLEWGKTYRITISEIDASKEY